MNVIIYGKTGCSNCDKAKLLCQMKSVNFDYKLVGQDITQEQLFEVCGMQVKTLPQIFIMNNGLAELVGGYEELKKIL